MQNSNAGPSVSDRLAQKRTHVREFGCRREGRRGAGSRSPLSIGRTANAAQPLSEENRDRRAGAREVVARAGDRAIENTQKFERITLNSLLTCPALSSRGAPGHGCDCRGLEGRRLPRSDQSLTGCRDALRHAFLVRLWRPNSAREGDAVALYFAASAPA